MFGETYSGLEYDYRGLCHVYESLNDTEKYLEYALILDTWKQLKEEQNRVNVSWFFNVRLWSIDSIYHWLEI